MKEFDAIIIGAGQAGGDEAIHGVIDIMHAGVTYDVLQHAVPVHPTVSELIPTMLGEMRPAESIARTASAKEETKWAGP